MSRTYTIRKNIVKNFTWYCVILFTFIISAYLSSYEFTRFDRVIKHNFNIVLLLLTFSLIPFSFFSKILNLLILFMLSLFTLVEIGHLFIFAARPTLNVFYTIFETQPGEVGEFFVTYFVSWKGLVLLALPFVWFFLSRQIGRLLLKVRYLDLAIALGIVINFAYFVRNDISSRLLKTIDTTPFYAINAGMQYYAEISKFQESKEHLPPLNYVRKTADYLDEQIIVVVIGESTSRRHMGLYGYQRGTTPHLSRRKNQMAVMTNVVSPHSHTKPSLEKTLTFRSHDVLSLEDAPSLVKLAKLAGYKTYWISNQIPLGLFETPVTAIAKSADKKFFLNKSEDFRNSIHDSILIPTFEKVLDGEDKRKMIFIHLMGTYNMRYPPEFSNFKGNISKVNGLTEDEIETINHYDNAVLYNDWILDQFIIKLEKAKDPNKMLVYFSDHAEEVYDFRKFHGHTEAIQSNFMFEVPFFTLVFSGAPEGKESS